MVAYLPRIVDDELDDLLGSLAAISIDGPKGVGKTATAARRAETVFALDDPAQVTLLSADPARLSRAEPPVLVDEWQRFPQVWDLVRRNVDADPSPGRYLLTGSAAPVTAPTHSGAGRIVRVRMRPLSFAERQVEQPTTSLRALLDSPGSQIEGQSHVDLSGYTIEILASGFPAIRRLAPRAQRAQLDGYIANVIDRSFVEQDHPVRRPTALRAWLAAYAAATSTTTSYNRLLDAATPDDSDKPVKSTAITYRNTLEQLWLLDPIPGWVPSRNHLGRLAQAPKHQLADPALAARLLGVDSRALLEGRHTEVTPKDGTLLGQLFESLVALSVRTYAQAAEAHVHHVRTPGGDHEIDLLVGRNDGRFVAFEVKLTTNVVEADVRHLHWLKSKLGGDLIDSVVVTTGEHAYRRPDGVAVIPLALLGP